ncbi:hypothetical protein [Streptomyces sp. NPDC046197]
MTMYGLCAEHLQKYRTIRHGNRGRTYFHQNEMRTRRPTWRIS